MKAVIRRQDLPGLVIIAVIGIGLTYLGFVKIRKAAESNKWPVAVGIVTNSEVGGAMKYYPSITYTYTIDTVVYSSNGLSNMNFNSKNRSYVEGYIKKYPLGSEVKVYYNRSKPSDSLLEPGITDGNLILLAIGIFLLAIPVCLLIFMKVDLKRS